MQNTSSLIARKRDGEALRGEEIEFLVEGFTQGQVADYQMSALAMAIYLRGMSPSETAHLTRAMLQSGTQLTWPSGSPVVDKHSTGGVGDKVSLILAPLLASCDFRVPMISGRGLGPTGGTLDKLEAIPGYRTDLSVDEIQAITERAGGVITGASEDIAPADRKLYALRDVTATVSSIPLITASIMSKKLAEGLDALALDVKVGNGAFMRSLNQARELAVSLARTGEEMGVRTAALITDMNQPLGRMIGNTVEVDESVEALRGEGPHDLMEVTYELGVAILLLTGGAENATEAKRTLEDSVSSGKAYERFESLVAAQGGDLRAARPRAPQSVLTASRDGCINAIDTQLLGKAIIELGGGRKKMGDPIDHSVGIEMLVRVGQTVSRKEPLMRIFAPQAQQEQIHDYLAAAITVADEVVPPLTLFHEQLGVEGQS